MESFISTSVQSQSMPPTTDIKGNMSQSGAMNNSKTKLNVAGKTLRQNLNGFQEGFGNNGKLISNLTTGAGGSTDTLGQFHQMGIGNKGLLKVRNNVGPGGSSGTFLSGSTKGFGNYLELKANGRLGHGAVGTTTLVGSVQGRGNVLKQTANSRLGNGAVSSNNLISDIGPGNIGISNSSQLGGFGTVKTANIVDNMTGND
jgi:hypothetical protein